MFLIIVAVIADVALVAPANAEGENWVPLYNKLARYLNERDLVGGIAPTPAPNQTQQQANQSYLDTNGTLTPETPITQNRMQGLRNRVINLAETKYALTASQMALDPAADGGTGFRSPSLFSQAGLPDANNAGDVLAQIV